MSITKKLLFIFLILILFLSITDGLFTIVNFNKTSSSVKFYDSSGSLFYTYMNGLKGYKTDIDIHKIPKDIVECVISAEDKRFYKHWGIDFRSLFRALYTNMKAGYIVSGGSTITQQVAKRNLSINNDLLSGKYIKKIRSLNSALWIDLFYSKDKILEDYLNNTYFGNMTYGIEEAAYTYFGKTASQLSLSEIASLIGSIRSPNSLNPSNSNEVVISRRNEVLDLMLKNGKISDSIYTSTMKSPISSYIHIRPEKYIHFAEYSIEEAKQILNITDTSKLSGYQIYTTLNYSISQKAEKSARDQVYALKKEHNISNASVVVLSGETSEILAMIGSIDYFDESIYGAVNISTSLRQPGSALKPITYAQAFYEGVISPDSIILDEKTVFVDSGGKSFVPYNYNGEFNGPVTARVALASSLNLPAVKVLEMVGVADMVETSQKLGISSLDNPERYDLSVTLGGGEVTLLELTNAYASFSREGKYKNTHSIHSILDPKGQVIYDYTEEKDTSVWGDKSEEIATTIYDILSDPVAKVLGFGRNNVLVLPFKAASKTGTTTDWHDNWTLGYTMNTSNDFVVGVWVGNSDHSPMYKLDGVTGAGPIWRDIMIYTHKHFSVDEENIEQIDLPQEKLSDEIPSLFQILNPPNNSIYYSLIANSEFEKIELETSTIEGMHSVEYILNGDSLGYYYNEDNFVYLWNPIKGTHNLEAIARNSKKEIIDISEITFTVNQE